MLDLGGGIFRDDAGLDASFDAIAAGEVLYWISVVLSPERHEMDEIREISFGFVVDGIRADYSIGLVPWQVDNFTGT